MSLPFKQGTIDEFVAGVQVGDVLHWWGTSALSLAIERFTDGGPSHVAMVRQICARTPDGIILVESTQIEEPKRFVGVVNRPFSAELADYLSVKGSGVWCPIRAALRAKVDWDAWGAWADSQLGNSYDYVRMVTEAYNSWVTAHHLGMLADIANRIASNATHHTEFCSELWCFLFQYVKLLSAARVPSMTAPLNSWQAAIYDPGVQILGTPIASFLGYSTVAP